MGNTGFVFTGAGARIAQECALTEALLEGLTPAGKKIRPQLISGASAGSLNAVMVNAILKTKEGKGGNFDWASYKKILFDLTDEEIFDNSARGRGRMLTHNIPRGYVLDTRPLRRWLSGILAETGFSTLGSLYVPTYISVVNATTGETLRLSSTNPDHADLPLLDILMASTAIPTVFPPSRIHGLDAEFIDGATGRDSVPVEALRGLRLQRIYVVSRARKRSNGTRLLKSKIKAPKILERTMFALDVQSDSIFKCELDMAAMISRKAYLYMPELSCSYQGLDFGTQREQYNETAAWARKNNPVELKPRFRRKFLGIF